MKIPPPVYRTWPKRRCGRGTACSKRCVRYERSGGRRSGLVVDGDQEDLAPAAGRREPGRPPAVNHHHIMRVVDDLISSLPHIPPPARRRRSGDICVWCGFAGDTACGGAPSGLRGTVIPRNCPYIALYTKNGRKCGYLVHRQPPGSPGSCPRNIWMVAERGPPFSPGEGDLLDRYHSSLTSSSSSSTGSTR